VTISVVVGQPSVKSPHFILITKFHGKYEQPVMIKISMNIVKYVLQTLTRKT